MSLTTFAQVIPSLHFHLSPSSLMTQQTYFFRNDTGLQEEEFIDIDSTGALHLVSSRPMSSYRPHTGSQEKVTKCVFDATQAIKFLVAHAAELAIDPSRVGFMGQSAGGGEINYLALVYPSLAGPDPGYVARSLVYTNAQLDLPIPLLDQGRGL